jgi:hypothetical protein
VRWNRHQKNNVFHHGGPHRIIPQELIIAKSKQWHDTVDQLVTIVADAIQQQTPVYDVEKKVFKTLLRVGLATIGMLVDCLGRAARGPNPGRDSGRRFHRREILHRLAADLVQSLSFLLADSSRPHNALDNSSVGPWDHPSTSGAGLACSVCRVVA